MTEENMILKDEDGEIAANEWKIEDDQDAEWAMRKIAEAQEECEKWELYYSRMLEKIKQKTDSTVSFMTMKLSEYFGSVPHKETKTQEKYSLPSGDLVMRKPKSVWDHDDEALLKWAKKNGFSECVKVSEKVSWADVKKRLVEGSNGIVCDAETGIVCDAVKATMSEPEFVLMMKK